MANQMRHLVRRLARAPLFTSVTVATLAIAIGANTAIFSVLDGVLLKPLPYPHPDQLVGLWHTAPGVNITDLNSAPFLYFTYREEGRTFQDVGLWTEGAASVTGLAEPESVTVPSRGMAAGPTNILMVCAPIPLSSVTSIDSFT